MTLSSDQSWIACVVSALNKEMTRLIGKKVAVVIKEKGVAV